MNPEALTAVEKRPHNGISPEGCRHPESPAVVDIRSAAVHKANGLSGRTHGKVETVLGYGGPFRRTGEEVGYGAVQGIEAVHAPVRNYPEAGVALLHHVPYDVVLQRSRFIGRRQEYPHSLSVPAVEAVPGSKPKERAAVLGYDVHGTVGQPVGVGDALYVVFGRRRVSINGPEQCQNADYQFFHVACHFCQI